MSTMFIVKLCLVEQHNESSPENGGGEMGKGVEMISKMMNGFEYVSESQTQTWENVFRNLNEKISSFGFARPFGFAIHF